MIVAEGSGAGVRPPRTAVLQWGRNLIVAEGNATVGVLILCVRSFNGAAT